MYSDEVADGKHTYCGHEVTEKAGSASGGLISIFNEQYAMPVEQFLSAAAGGPSSSWWILVDGVDVQIDSKQKLGGITYEPGVQTLGGQAALEYVLQKDKGVGGDIDRLLRQRRVMTRALPAAVRPRGQGFEGQYHRPVNERFDTHPQQLGHRSDALHADKTLQ